MKNVLIVDDDSDLLKLYKQVFLNASFSVDVSLTVSKANELIGKKKYDVILLDILFPEADIFSTIRLIRSRDSLNIKTPVLVLTNLQSGEKTKKALEFGADECLFKTSQTPKTILETAMKLANINNSDKINQITDQK